MQFSSLLHCYLFGPLSVGDGDGDDRLRVLRDILHVMEESPGRKEALF